MFTVCISSTKAVNNSHYQVSEGDYRQEIIRTFPEIRNQLWKGELWNHSYYVETIGSVSEENIRRYIEHQSKSY